MKKKIRKGRPHIYFLIASFVEKKIPPQFPSKSNFTLMAPIFICPQQILRKFVVDGQTRLEKGKSKKIIHLKK